MPAGNEVQVKICCMGDAHYSISPFQATRHGHQSQQFYESYFEQFFAQDADLYIALGDLCNWGSEAEIHGVFEIINRFNKNFILVPGNHDYFTFGREDFYRLSGQCINYAIHRDGCCLIFLDNCRPLNLISQSGTMDREQFEFLNHEIQKAAGERILVFSHFPAEMVRFEPALKHYCGYSNLSAYLTDRVLNGYYFNAHRHLNDFRVKHGWQFIQFSDILNDAKIRIIEADSLSVRIKNVDLVEDSLQAALKVSRKVPFFRSKSLDYRLMPEFELFNLALVIRSEEWLKLNFKQRLGWLNESINESLYNHLQEELYKLSQENAVFLDSANLTSEASDRILQY